ncbi:unnamed protein product [Paramecium octaurelia]|uniref:Protein kinase domain-containing protein n=1 Tax=Paramecium octaurelia TaxID=43137 RepID=A0A8S1WD33_PAROT|nr:unnamed protein product [Paramecium octaurelia]
MEYIAYTDAKFQFLGTRKHFFRDKQYYVSVFEDCFIMGNTCDTQSPKYKISFDLNIKLNWDLKKQENGVIIQSFVFPYKNSFKTLYAKHDDLMKQLEYFILIFVRFKELLGQSVTYEGIGDLYLPILQIGKGSSAKVYSAQDILNQNIYAIKAIEKSFLNQTEKGSGLAAYKMEVQILKILSPYSKNFLTLKEIYEGDHTFYLVTDYLEGTTLSEEIEKAKNLPDRRLPIQTIKVLMYKLLTSLVLLHENNIIHRDLKPDNLMFAKKNDYSSLVLVDFGLATLETLDKFLFPKCGTPGYVAPEVLNLNYENKYTTKVDIFSSGCILYKLLTGKSIFGGKTFDDVLITNKKCYIDLDLPIDHVYVTDLSLNLLGQLLNKNAKQRISARQALCHPFFEQINEQSTQALSAFVTNVKFSQNGNLNLQCEEQTSKYDVEEYQINSEMREEEQNTITIPQTKRCSLMNEVQSLSRSPMKFYQKEPLSAIRFLKFMDLASPKGDSNEIISNDLQS